MVLGEDYYLEILNSHRTVIVSSSGINTPVKPPDRVVCLSVIHLKVVP